MSADEASSERVPAEDRRFCPRCGRDCRPDETICLYCDQDLSQPASPRLKMGQFSLAFVLAVMAAVAVTLGAYRQFPSATIGLWIVLFPALVRTAVAAYLRRSHGGQYSARGLTITFLVSLAAMIPVLTIAFAAFLAGMLIMIIVTPFSSFLFPPLGNEAMLIPKTLAALGACYGFWVTRPTE